MSCPYCGFEVAADGTCSRCGRAESSVSLSGWRPDPTARYEGRYYTAGRPTNRVRNGKHEASDPTGGQMLPDYVELPASRSSIRTTWITTGAVTAIIVMAAAMAWGLLVAHRRPPPPPETGYLAALRDTGLMNQFNSDANAIAHGHQVCRRLEDGEPQQGQPADKIAVDTFCPHFAQGFHVLDTVKVSGIFVLTDSLGAEECRRRILVHGKQRLLRHRARHRRDREERQRRDPDHHDTRPRDRRLRGVPVHLRVPRHRR